MLVTSPRTARSSAVAVLALLGSLIPAAAAFAASAVPGTPTNVIASATPRAVTVSWTPADSEAETYLVLSSPGLKSCSVDAPGTSCTISGLLPYKAYKFKVLAGNDLGESAFSAFTAPVTPADKPDKITGTPSVSAGDGQISVSWNASTSNVGSAVTSYTATASPGGASCAVSAPTTNCVITGLNNGTYYSVSVTATNAIGTSVPSFSSSAVKPSGLPLAPATVTATATSHDAVRVTWSAAGNNGGETPSYAVTRSPVGDSTTCYTDKLFCDFSGLTSGTEYVFTVVARNSKGDAAGKNSNAVTPVATTPYAPTNVAASVGDGTAIVTWSAATPRGTDVTGYIVSALGVTSCETTLLTCSFTGLSNGTNYAFSVVATSAAGNSAAGTSNSATPSGKPFAPTGVTAQEVGKGTLTQVSWTASQSNGSAITKYTVTSSPAGASCSTTSTSCELGGLTTGVAYTFSVVASNANGDSPSATSASFTPVAVRPGALTDVKMKRSAGAATISVGGLEYDGGLPATYAVTLSPGGGSCTITPDAVGAGSCTVSGLTNATLYSAYVVARNTIGSGPATEIDPPFDAWVTTNTVLKGGSFTVYFVGALPRSTVSLTYGRTTKSVKADALGAGSATFSASTAGVAEVKASYGVVRASAGSVAVPAQSLVTRALAGAAVNLSVLYTGKNAVVTLTQVGVGVLETKNTGDATTASFTVDTSTKGKKTYRVSINGVTLADIAITVA